MSVPEKYTYRLPSFLFFIFLCFQSLSQVNTSLEKLVDTTNLYYRASDLLNLGELYRPEHVYAKGHPYFVTDEYTLASVSVNNTSFENIKARYNIATDQLIIKARVDSGLLVSIVTRQDWVRSFSINDHYFISMGQVYPDNLIKGYCEQVYKGKQLFYIKYQKKFIDTYTDVTPEGFFSVLKLNKYIYDNGKFISVDTKRAFLKLYDNKKAIKKFMHDNKIRYSKASSVQLNMLMQFCDGLPKSI